MTLPFLHSIARADDLQAIKKLVISLKTVPVNVTDEIPS